MKERIVHDISELPDHAFGARMTAWWGNLGFMALEGTGFALAGGAYLYLKWLNPEWPLDVDPPNLLWSTLLVALLVLSAIPNFMVMRAAKDQDRRKVQILLVVMCVIGVLAIVLRTFEFMALNIRWDQNAYGSLLWFLLGLHTTHLVTDLGDTIVLTVMMFTRHGTGKRFSDADDNAIYWNFVIVSWVLIYLLLYWGARI